MFERYTEKARRTIFFARYEASQLGSPYIETEHLLLGLLRENRALATWLRGLSGATDETLRDEIERRVPKAEKVSTAIDLPLADAGKRALAYALEEADHLQHQQIGTEHLFLGLLRDESCLAATLLLGRGVTLDKVRARVSQTKGGDSPTERPPAAALGRFVIIHGTDHSLLVIGQRASRYRRFHWERKPWTPVDVVMQRATGMVSFDLSLAGITPEMEVVKGGWKADECVVCGWKLSDQLGPEHATGFTNGRDWICEECHEKFWVRPDFLAGGFSAIT
jgi:hypothetical protein